MTNFRIKDPGSAITHFIGAVFSAFVPRPGRYDVYCGNDRE